MATDTDKNSSVYADSFIHLGVIGQGSFSEVHKVRRAQDGKIYALKRIKLPSLKPKEQQYAISQVKILAALSSPYIIGFRESFYDSQKQQLCVVMEWANQGDLQADINKRRQSMQAQIRSKSIKSKQDELAIRKKFSIPESEIWRAIRDILAGLSLLHKSSILHRDIKTANIFKSSGIYKLGDLNIAKICPGLAYAYTQTGTPYYASPQVWKQLPYNTKSDIWSFGCVIYEMCELQPPFSGKDMGTLYESVIRGHYRKLNNHIYSRDLIQFVNICLRVDARQRKQANELLLLPTLQSRLRQYKIRQQFLRDEEDNFESVHQSINLSQDKQLSIKLTKQLRQYRSITQPTDFQQVSSYKGRHLVASSQMLDKIQKILPGSNYPSQRRKNFNKSECNNTERPNQRYEQKISRPQSCKTNENQNKILQKYNMKRLLLGKEESRAKIEVREQRLNILGKIPLSDSMHQDDKKKVKQEQRKEYEKILHKGVSINMGSGHKKSKKCILMLPLRPKPRFHGSYNMNKNNSKNEYEKEPNKQNLYCDVKGEQKIKIGCEQTQKVSEKLKDERDEQKNQSSKYLQKIRQQLSNELSKEIQEGVNKKYKYKYKYKYECDSSIVRPKSQNFRTELYTSGREKQFRSLVKRQEKQTAKQKLGNRSLIVKTGLDSGLTQQKVSGGKVSSYGIQKINGLYNPYLYPRGHESVNELPRIRNMLKERNSSIRQQIGKIYYNYNQSDMKCKQKYNMAIHVARPNANYSPLEYALRS